MSEKIAVIMGRSLSSILSTTIVSLPFALIVPSPSTYLWFIGGALTARIIDVVVDEVRK